MSKFTKVEQDGTRYVVSARPTESDEWREVENIARLILAEEFATELEEDDAKRREYWDDAAQSQEAETK